MSRHPSHTDHPGPRQRALLAGAALLSLVLVGALLLPEGGEPDEGALTPAAEPAYAARTTPPPVGDLDARARREVDRALDEEGEVRCAVFEGQRYCLGVGWTTRTAAEEEALVATERAERSGRRTTVETTGDLTTADLLAQRAAMAPREREEAERAELEAAARSVAKVVLLRHHVLGEPLPEGFLERHPEARATATTPARAATRRKGFKDYPRRDTVLSTNNVREQRRSYWCGPATMQMIAWGWQDERRRQRHWARRLGTTTNGSAISEMVRVINKATGYDRPKRAGTYVVLDISDWSFKQWMLLQLRHVHDYRAPLVLHPVLEKQYYPYLDDDASGHFQVGRGYDKNGRRPGLIGYFEPWNQQRFDPSEPRIARVQWRRAYNSFRANKAHPHQNIGV